MIYKKYINSFLTWKIERHCNIKWIEYAPVFKTYFDMDLDLNN